MVEPPHCQAKKHREPRLMWPPRCDKNPRGSLPLHPISLQAAEGVDSKQCFGTGMDNLQSEGVECIFFDLDDDTTMELGLGWMAKKSIPSSWILCMWSNLLEDIGPKAGWSQGDLVVLTRTEVVVKATGALHDDIDRISHGGLFLDDGQPQQMQHPLHPTPHFMSSDSEIGASSGILGGGEGSEGPEG